MKGIGERGQALKEFFLRAVDRDTEAFNGILAAMRLPKKTPEDQEVRNRAVQAANETATRVPLEVLEKTVEAMEAALEVAGQGNPNSVSDAGVAGACALAAAEGASLNVRINLPSVEDEKVRGEILAGHDVALQRARETAAQVARTVDEILEGAGA
jgi:glutamate formiminotransferase/formiminotetrahydrofolate cyclodeaminase